MTSKTWAHVVDEHDYMAGHLDMVLETISDPDLILEGKSGELVASRFYDETRLGPKHLIVVYKEVSPTDGYVLTAYMTSNERFGRLRLRRRTLWSQVRS